MSVFEIHNHFISLPFLLLNEFIIHLLFYYMHVAILYYNILLGPLLYVDMTVLC